MPWSAMQSLRLHPLRGGLKQNFLIFEVGPAPAIGRTVIQKLHRCRASLQGMHLRLCYILSEDTSFTLPILKRHLPVSRVPSSIKKLISNEGPRLIPKEALQRRLHYAC